MKELKELLDQGKRYDEVAIALLKGALECRDDLLSSDGDAPPIEYICEMNLECIMEDVNEIIEDLKRHLDVKIKRTDSELLRIMRIREGL